MVPTRLFDFIQHQKESHPQQKAVGGKNAAGEWQYYSTDEIIDKANKVSRGLLKLGVKPGDKVALVVYKNRPEWVIMDIGIQQIGAINVPVYPTISPDDYNYIFNDAGVKICVAGIGDLYDKVNAIIDEVPTLESIYTFDRHEGRLYWEDMFSDEGQEEVEQLMADVKPEELATIIYTSGTTGNPKGVMLSHTNIVSNVVPVQQFLPIDRGDIALSFLPLCHIFERTAIYAFVNKGVNVVFTGTDNLGGETGDLQAIKPHYFNTVPRLLEKVYEKIYNKGLELSGAKKSLFFWALGLTDDYDYDMKPGGLSAIKWSIADKLIFSKWREALGGRVKGVLTGAAPCPVKIMRVFSAAGIPIREAYGLTETSPGLTFNRFEPYGAKMGTVGQTFPGVEIKIDTEGDYREGEGEILAKGPNIMMGYYNKPEATAAVIEESNGERWFRTGDVGTWQTDAKGNKYVKITDRKKELLKTSGGKYVAPAPIESLFKEDFLVEHIMVVGDKRKFVSALIVPAEEALKNYCEECGVGWNDMNEAIKDPTVQARYQQLVDQLNPKFSKIEKIKKFRLIPTTWDAVKEDGSTAELTPTMKLKRRVILEKFAREIEELYDV